MASLTYEENRIAKYKQLLRQAFADGLLSHNQIERLEAIGFDFTPSKGSLIEIVPDITCAFCPEDNPGIELSRLSARGGKDIVLRCPQCGRKYRTKPNYLTRKVNPLLCKSCSLETSLGGHIRCIETGEVFVSLRGAARMLVETGMSTAPIENTRRHLYGCMKSGKSFAYGCHWEYVDGTDKSQNGGLL